jgi:hypothetical protein
MRGAVWVLVPVCLGCATIEPTELCTTDARPMTPKIQLNFVSMEYEVECFNTTARTSKAKLVIKSSWIREALAGVAAAGVALLVQDAPPTTPEEDRIPTELLSPAIWTDPHPMELGLMRCGPMLNRRWCQ